MDAKDLRTETTIGERSNNGSSTFAQGEAATPCSKPYENISTNPLAKLEAPTSRPCAVIGPDRIVPPSNGDAYSKKGHYEPWFHVDNTYRQPPEYPHKIPSYQSPMRNISPRQTFQENMQRIMVQPTYNSVKLSDDPNYTLDRNTAKNSKITGPHEAKYFDVPYSVNSVSSDQKPNEMCVTNMSSSRTYPQMWHPGSVGIRPTRPYGAPDLYQFPEYTNCAGPRPMQMSRPHRTINEDPSHPFGETYYPEGNIRFKPYPTIKERYPQARYEYLSNYANAFHPPPPFPTHKYDLQKPLPPHVTYPQGPVKYLDNRMPDTVMDGYQRPQTINYNLPYRNQVIHPAYGPMIGSNIPNKVYPYPPDGPVKSLASNKLPYDSKLYAEYENARSKGYPVPENVYLNEMVRPPLKNQPMLPNYPAPNMQQLHAHPYYRKDNLAAKNYEYMSHLRHLDPSLNPNALPRLSTQFSPNAIAISPSDSNTSNETSHTHGGSLEDCGYVSQSSTASIRSFDSMHRMIPNDFHQRYTYPYQTMIRTSPLSSKNDGNGTVNSSKDKKGIDVRQFLQMWNEGEDENGGKEKEVVTQSDIHASKLSNHYDSTKTNEQLYVLGLVNVPSEELSKYEHIQKISKLPENIKGYNNIELLKHFEEAIESSNISNSNHKPPTPRYYQPSMKNSLVHGTGLFLPRPISPLDVEAKISQSVIHKEVGCNFEIKPCSPEMLNAEVATTAQTLLEDERVIEKVSNPIIIKSPISISTAENDKSCDGINKKEHRIMLKEDANKTASCKMINTQCSNNEDISVAKANYSIQDLESNAGVCLASLPRLDNDIELNFPEVNQQFINANKESVIISNDFTSEIDALPNNNNYKIDEHLILKSENTSSHMSMLDMETEVSKLSKFRKIKRNEMDYSEKQFHTVSQSLRTDSVIIKNPENVKSYEKNPEMATLEKKANDNQLANHDVINIPMSDDDSQINTNKPEDTNEMAIDFSLSRLENNPTTKNYNNLCEMVRHPNLQAEKNAMDQQLGEDANTASNSTNDILMPKGHVPDEVNDINMTSVSENIQKLTYSPIEVENFDIKNNNEVHQQNVIEYSENIPEKIESPVHKVSHCYNIVNVLSSDKIVTKSRECLIATSEDGVPNKTMKGVINSSVDNVNERVHNSLLNNNLPTVSEHGTTSKIQNQEITQTSDFFDKNFNKENDNSPSSFKCNITTEEVDDTNKSEIFLQKEVTVTNETIEADTCTQILPRLVEIKNSFVNKVNLSKELFSPQMQNLILWSEGKNCVCIPSQHESEMSYPNLVSNVSHVSVNNLDTDKDFENNVIQSKLTDVDDDRNVCYTELEVPVDENITSDNELPSEFKMVIHYSHYESDAKATAKDNVINVNENTDSTSVSNDAVSNTDAFNTQNFICITNLNKQPNVSIDNTYIKDSTVTDSAAKEIFAVESLQTVEDFSKNEVQADTGDVKDYPVNSLVNSDEDFSENKFQLEATVEKYTNKDYIALDCVSSEFQSIANNFVKTYPNSDSCKKTSTVDSLKTQDESPSSKSVVDKTSNEVFNKNDSSEFQSTANDFVKTCRITGLDKESTAVDSLVSKHKSPAVESTADKTRPVFGKKDSSVYQSTAADFVKTHTISALDKETPAVDSLNNKQESTLFESAAEKTRADVDKKDSSVYQSTAADFVKTHTISALDEETPAVDSLNSEQESTLFDSAADKTRPDVDKKDSSVYQSTAADFVETHTTSALDKETSAVDSLNSKQESTFFESAAEKTRADVDKKDSSVYQSTAADFVKTHAISALDEETPAVDSLNSEQGSTSFDSAADKTRPDVDKKDSSVYQSTAADFVKTHTITALDEETPAVDSLRSKKNSMLFESATDKTCPVLIQNYKIQSTATDGNSKQPKEKSEESPASSQSSADKTCPDFVKNFESSDFDKLNSSEDIVHINSHSDFSHVGSITYRAKNEPQPDTHLISGSKNSSDDKDKYDVADQNSIVEIGNNEIQTTDANAESSTASNLNSDKECSNHKFKSETAYVKDFLLSNSILQTSDVSSIVTANNNFLSESSNLIDCPTSGSDVEIFPEYENSRLQSDCTDNKDFDSYSETFDVVNLNVSTVKSASEATAKHCSTSFDSDVDVSVSDIKKYSLDPVDSVICVNNEQILEPNSAKKDFTHYPDIFNLDTKSDHIQKEIYVSNNISSNSNSPRPNQNYKDVEICADLYEPEPIADDSCVQDIEIDSNYLDKQVICSNEISGEDLNTKGTFVRRGLKRSLSDSALHCYNKSDIGLQEDIELHNLVATKKRRKNNEFANNGDPYFSTTDVLNINNNRRNSISSVYNEENMSFCIVIDNNCIITEENEEGEKLCYTEIPEACLTSLHTESFEETSEIVLCPPVNTDEYEEPFVLKISDEKSLEESWVDDVACVETVVSDDIAEDVELSAPTSPAEINEQMNELDECEMFISVSDHAEKVKYIYGDKMCNDDAELVETLYRTPQMDVNKTLTNKESHVSDDDDEFSMENTKNVITPINETKTIYKPIVLAESDTGILNQKNNGSETGELSALAFSQDVSYDATATINKQSFGHDILCEKNNKTETDRLLNVSCISQVNTINSCESSVDNIFSYDLDRNMSDYPVFSSPEVSSTTSEEKNTSLLLKITNHQGTRKSQINDLILTQKNSCKFTENINYTNFISNSTEPRPLITKAAQKYIPPLRETVEDLKVKLHLPRDSLVKFKQLKMAKSGVRPTVPLPKNDIPKKPKPKFEDVLKSIDELQFKMHREKSKKPKKTIPKVVIKKTENGSHYASTPQSDCYNPDLTGRKWQPWVFIEKNNFIDKMALRRKNKAIYNHRNNTYVFADKFKKYKSMQSSKFVISQPKLDNNSSAGQLKYTIRLKHSY